MNLFLYLRPEEVIVCNIIFCLIFEISFIGRCKNNFHWSFLLIIWDKENEFFFIIWTWEKNKFLLVYIITIIISVVYPSSPLLYIRGTG